MPYAIAHLDTREHFSFGVRNLKTDDVDWFETKKEAKDKLKELEEKELEEAEKNVNKK